MKAGSMRALCALFMRDVRLVWRQGGGIGTALGFFLAIVIMLPLAIGPDLVFLQKIAPGILWVILLLCVLLSTERLFAQDYRDGSLEIFTMTSLPLELFVLAKIAAHWLSTSLPLAFIAPILGFLLNLAPQDLIPLMLAMLVGSLSLSLIAAIGGALMVGLRRGGLLIALLIFPLYVPILIFGVAASTVDGQTGSLIVLIASFVALLVLAPIAAASALRAYLHV